MANPEHVKILEYGVEIWNKWRVINPRIAPDLIDANLFNANLTGADLSSAKLFRADLRNAGLSNANLSSADLSSVNLIKADLRSANLRSVNLVEANLSYADLAYANLIAANLYDANLIHANLYGVDLFNSNITNADLSSANLSNAQICADLSRAKLIYANLTGADLSSADLVDADLSYANLTGANLIGANLSSANLSSANLRSVDLVEANLSYADLSKANFNGSKMIQANLTAGLISGVNLYGSARDDWVIDEVKCDYVYWDADGEDRTPRERDFKPGEFEALYKSLPTIEYHFDNGFTPFDAVLIDRIVQGIVDRHPEFELKLDSFHSRGTPRAVFTVLHKEDADQALHEIKHDYEKRIAALEAHKDSLEKCFALAIDQPRQIIGRIEMGDTIHGDQIKGTQGDATIAKDQATVTIQKITNPAAKDLIEQIGRLIKQSDADDLDREEAQDQLIKMGRELEREKPDQGRLRRIYDRMVDALPKIAEKLPWDKIVGAILT